MICNKTQNACNSSLPPTLRSVPFHNVFTIKPQEVLQNVLFKSQLT